MYNRWSSCLIKEDRFWTIIVFLLFCFRVVITANWWHAEANMQNATMLRFHGDLFYTPQNIHDLNYFIYIRCVIPINNIFWCFDESEGSDNYIDSSLLNTRQRFLVLLLHVRLRVSCKFMIFKNSKTFFALTLHGSKNIIQ